MSMRSLLSMNRRGGLQVPPEVAAGRVQRHQQNWREANDFDDGLDAFRGIVIALVMMGALLFAGAVVTIAAVHLLG